MNKPHDNKEEPSENSGEKSAAYTTGEIFRSIRLCLNQASAEFALKQHEWNVNHIGKDALFSDIAIEFEKGQTIGGMTRYDLRLRGDMAPEQARFISHMISMLTSEDVTRKAIPKKEEGLTQNSSAYTDREVRFFLPQGDAWLDHFNQRMGQLFAKLEGKKDQLKEMFRIAHEGEIRFSNTEQGIGTKVFVVPFLNRKEQLEFHLLIHTNSTTLEKDARWLELTHQGLEIDSLKKDFTWHPSDASLPVITGGYKIAANAGSNGIESLKKLMDGNSLDDISRENSSGYLGL